MPDANLIEAFSIPDELCKYFIPNSRITYNLMPKKLSLNIGIIDKSRLIA